LTIRGRGTLSPFPTYLEAPPSAKFFGGHRPWELDGFGESLGPNARALPPAGSIPEGLNHGRSPCGGCRGQAATAAHLAAALEHRNERSFIRLGRDHGQTSDGPAPACQELPACSRCTAMSGREAEFGGGGPARPPLRQLDTYSGTLPVRCALGLVSLVFVRLGELVTAAWAGIDPCRRAGSKCRSRPPLR